MGNEKYVNYFIDTMTQTMNEFLTQSISLKANSKVIEELLNEQITLNENLKSELENANSLLEQGEQNFYDKQSEEIGSLHYELDVAREQNSNLQSECQTLRDQINTLSIEVSSIRNEKDNLFSQAQHVETFRNELLKSREENSRLNNLIAELKQQSEEDIEKILLDNEKEIDKLNAKIKEYQSKIKLLQNPPKPQEEISSKPTTKTSAKPKIVVKDKAIKDGGTF